MQASKANSSRRSWPRAVLGVGPLRLALIGVALAAVLAFPFATTPPVYRGWAVVSTVVVPVLVPLVFMVLMLDALMGRIFMAEKTGTERARYRVIVMLNLLLALMLLVVWLPFFRALGR